MVVSVYGVMAINRVGTCGCGVGVDSSLTLVLRNGSLVAVLLIGRALGGHPVNQDAVPWVVMLTVVVISAGIAINASAALRLNIRRDSEQEGLVAHGPTYHYHQ